MSVKRTIIVAAAALAVVTGAGAAGTLTARAQTPQCGAQCIDIFSAKYGTAAHPHDILAVTSQSGVAGTPITLKAAVTTDPGEDFSATAPVTVDDLYQAGLIAAGMNALYGNLEAEEFQYAPFGAPTGLCIGVGTTPAAGTAVTLQNCGVTVKTIWIPEARKVGGATFFLLINGATASDFADPFVLTTGAPGLGLITARVTPSAGFLTQQLWASVQGALGVNVP